MIITKGLLCVRNHICVPHTLMLLNSLASLDCTHFYIVRVIESRSISRVTELVSDEPVISTQICDFITHVLSIHIICRRWGTAYECFFILLQSIKEFFCELPLSLTYVFSTCILIHWLILSTNIDWVLTIFQEQFHKNLSSHGTFVLLWVLCTNVMWKTYSNMHHFSLRWHIVAWNKNYYVPTCL